MKSIIKLNLLFLFIFFLDLSSQAQNFLNILNARYYYLPDNKTNVMEDNVSLREYRLESAFPYTLKDSNIIGIKILFKSLKLSSDNSDYKDLNLHTIKLPFFTFLKFKNPKWSTYLEVSPKLNSDFENITFNHFQIGSTILFFKERKPGFSWQFGVYYNQDTYGPFFMPLGGFNWKISDKSFCSLLLPAYMIFEQKISKKLYIGFEMEMTGETFRLGGSKYKDSYISQLGENKLTFLAEPRLFLDYYVTKHFVIYVKPGFRMFQKYEHFTNEDKLVFKTYSKSEYVEGKLSNSFYAEAGIAMRFRYDEK